MPMTLNRRVVDFTSSYWKSLHQKIDHFQETGKMVKLIFDLDSVHDLALELDGYLKVKKTFKIFNFSKIESFN